MLRRITLTPVVLIALLVLPLLLTPTPQAHAQSCGTAPAPRLNAGQSARVTLTDGPGNNLRADASTSATALGVLPDGEIISVISGPQCASDIYWWQVRRTNGQTGWTGEGDANGYWLEPWPATAAQPAPGTLPALPELTLAYLSGYEGYLVPHTIAADGSALQPRGDEGADGNRVVWSPDGTQIAFSDGESIWLLGEFDALEIAPDSGSAHWPSFAPDGSRVAFAQMQTGSSAIAIYELSTNAIRSLTTVAAQNTQPAWSPDGTRIAFVSDREGNAELYTIMPDGTGLQRLTTTPGDEAVPVWSPDGTRIAYTVTENDVTRLAVLTPGQEPVLFEALGVDGIPAWSPDSSRIAYIAKTAADSEQSNLFSIGATGQGNVQYTTNGGIIAGVTWSPGGQWIAFADNSGGNFDLYLIRPNGTGLAKLTQNPGIDVYPTFVPPTAPNLPDEIASTAGDEDVPASAPGSEDLLLIYDASIPVFTLQNVSGQALNLRPLSFIGNGLTVRPEIWDEYTASPIDAFKSVGCLMIWGFGLNEQPAPSECGDARQGWLTNDNYLFWTQGSFEVRYNDIPVAACDGAAGRCTVDLP